MSSFQQGGRGGGGYRGGGNNGSRGRGGRGFRGRGRSGGGRGGSSGGPAPMLGLAQEPFNLDVCKFFMHRNGCKFGDNCQHGHVITQMADVNVAPQGVAVNALVQWQEKNVFTATDEGCVKMWNTLDGKAWNKSDAVINFHERQQVGALVEANDFLFCGYEGPFPLAAAAGGGVAGGGANGHQQRAAGQHTDSRQQQGGPSAETLSVGNLRVVQLNSGSEQEVVLQADARPYAHTRKVLCIALGSLGAAGAVVCTGGDDGDISMWTPSGTGAFGFSSTLVGHVRGVTALKFVGSLLWSASKDHTLRVWDLAQEQRPCVGIIGAAAGGHTGPISSLVVIEGKDPEDPTTLGKTFVVSGGADMEIKVWDALVGTAIYSHNSGARVTALTAIESSPAGPLLLVGHENGAISVRDFPGFNLAFEINSDIFGVGHRGKAVRTLCPLVIAGTPNIFFVSGAADGKMMVWSLSLPS